MNDRELWEEFCKERKIDVNAPYEAWEFGGAPDELAKLVKEGVKFGTASAYDLYEEEDALDELPKVGDYSIILDSKGEAVCVIRDYDVRVKRFAAVSPFDAFSEGEDDKSLTAWRRIHKDFFNKEFEGTDLSLTYDSKIVCEKFALEYLAGGKIPKESELLFTEPTMNYADEIKAYREEMLEAGSSFDGCFSMKRMPDVSEYVDYCTNWADPSRERDEKGIRGMVLLCIRKSDNRMVGCMQLHYEPSDWMTNYTGLIGYSVRPSERRKGYASKMLAKGVKILKACGFDEVTVSCLPDNEASRKTILKNGGKYLETAFFERDNVYLERYSIIS